MDEIIFFGGLALLVLLGPWIFVGISSRRRKREREEDRQRWADLTRRVYDVETAVRTFRASPAGTAAPGAPATSPRVEGPPRPTTPEPAVPSREVSPAERRAVDWVKAQPAEPTSAPPSPPTPSAPQLPPTPVPPREPVVPPSFASVDSGSKGRMQSVLDVEQTLGTNWLNKLGIALIVLGAAFGLSWAVKEVGPAGKVLVGYLFSAAMLAAGIWFERSERYRVLARAGVAGGWALLFFTTYAMYHVEATRILSSQPLDLILMLLVAAAMVWHTLRYRSQVVTGLAFLLAFMTVTVSHSNVYSLSAGAVLATALVVIVLRMQWFELEVFGILASYLNHYLWLRPIIEPMRGHRHPFPEFAASAGILILYWAIFRVSYVFRLPKEAEQERISTVAGLLNPVLLMLLLKYQSVHPEWAFWALLAIGAVETALGQLPITRRRRTAVIVLTTLGVILLIAAFPFRYSGSRLSVLWLLEAEALLPIGVWTREIIFRRLGMLAGIVVAGQMISVDAAQVAGIRMDGADLRSDYPLAILFAVAAAVFYFNSQYIAVRWKELFSHTFDRTVMNRLSYVGAVMVAIATWLAFPEAWTAVAWCATGLLLAWLGRRFQARELGFQASALAAAAILRALTINLRINQQFHGASLRLITVGLVGLLLYTTPSLIWTGDGKTAFGSRVFALASLVNGSYTWAASFLLGLLAWYELQPVGVAVAWAMSGLVLVEAGLGRKSLALRCQAYAAFLASFTRIFFVNLNASGSPGEVSPRFYTVVPIALAYFYAYVRLDHEKDGLGSTERRFKLADLCCYLGTISIAGLMRFELEADWVAAAWAALAVVLLAIAWRSGRRTFLHQSLLLAFGVLFRTSLHNFYQRSYFPAPPWESRAVCVGVVIALLVACLPIAMRLSRKNEPDAETAHRSRLAALVHGVTRRPEQVYFFIAVALLTVLIALEMNRGMVTLSWGVEGVAIFLLALWLGERSFRLTGLGLLLLCVAKILVVDVWELGLRDRFLTFLVLGGALFLVSFLYTRYGEKLRQYL